MSESIIETVVTKTFFYNDDQRTMFRDTIRSINNKIHYFNNDKGQVVETPRVLLDKAAKCFSLKDYKGAYAIYKKLLEQEPYHPMGNYRMGVLAFWYGKKCGIGAKEGREEGKRCMQRATRYFEYAETVLYYMNHGLN